MGKQGIFNENFKYEIGQIIKAKNGNVKILDRYYGKNRKGYRAKFYLYQCLNCPNIEEINEEKINDKFSCNCCCTPTKKILKGYNDIATTHPWILDYLVVKEDAFKYSFHSDKTILVKCPNCNSEKEMIVKNIIRRGFTCQKCGDKITIPNKIMFNVLEQLNINFETEYSPKWCKYLFKNKLKQGRYDYYIPSLNIIIEMDGGMGHGKENNRNGQTSKESKYIDNEKDRLANEHGIEIIRIDCDYGHNDKLQYIKQNILVNQELNNLFNLNKIDWIDVQNFIVSSRVIEACNYWNNGIRSAKEIALIMKLDRSTITNYLNIGREIEKCDYDPKIASSEAHSKAGKESGKPILCLNNMMIFENARDCCRQSFNLFKVEIGWSAICSVCRGSHNQTKGYKFRYISDLTQEEYIKYDIANKLKELNKTV